MERPGKLPRLLSALCSLAILICTVYSVLAFFTVGGDGNMTVIGAACFRYFTVDSNLFAAAAAIPLLLFAVRGRPLPKWLLALKYTSAASVTLTMMTVLVFLGPLMGYRAMFAGANLYMHLTTPLLAILSLIFFDNRTAMPKRSILLSLLPTFVYGTLYLILVQILGVWPDFYHFAANGLWYVSYVAMHLGTALLGWLLWLLRRKAGSIHKKDGITA